MIETMVKTSQTRAVSESIGFLLMFTLVIVGIGLVTLYGYPMLLQQQTNADEQIMEKNMIVLQNDIKGLVYKTVPYKETSLKIGGGSLSIRNSTHASPYSRITIEDSINPPFIDDFRPGDLVYASTSAASDITLQNGAVLKRQYVQEGASVMLAQPRWFYDGETSTMVINLVNLTSPAPFARSGVGSVQMALGDTDFQIAETTAVPPTLSPPVYLVYTPDPRNDYSVAWDNYFQKNLGMTLDPASLGSPGDGTGNPIRYRFPPVSRLVIKKSNVNIISI